MSDHLGEHDPWTTLALAVIHQAVLDVYLGHPALIVEAKLWLRNTGVSWCQIMDISEDILDDWLDNDFCLLDHPRRNWRY